MKEVYRLREITDEKEAEIQSLKAQIKNPCPSHPGMSCSEVHEDDAMKISNLSAEIETERNRHRAWTDFFQETQLSHVGARIEKMERDLKRERALTDKAVEALKNILAGQHHYGIIGNICANCGDPFPCVFQKGKDALTAIEEQRKI